METIEISGVLGMTAAVLLTINICMGILMRTAYKKLTIWKQFPEKYKFFKMVDLHNYTSYGVLIIVLIHVLILPLDPNSGFSFKSLLWPSNNLHQPFFVWLGYISFVAVLLVIITSQKIIKNALGFSIWKNIHVISYMTGILFIVHAIVMDPLLKDRAVDFIDAEKVFMELCAIILLAAFYWRYQYARKQKKTN
jgi:sulfoxide reductase heme-binding subunit YedZ